MTLYLDTEFNGFGGQLISLALVSDTSGHFYGVLPLPENIEHWVKKNVIPHLGQTSEPTRTFRLRLREFLQAHAGEVIIADSPDDFIYLLSCMFDDGGMSFQIGTTMKLINSPKIGSEVPHNALSDARALMLWHKAATGTADADSPASGLGLRNDR